MQRKLRDLLRLADLKEEEVQVYLHVLKLGTATIPALTHSSGLANITVYRAVQSLEEQGLLEAQPLNNKQNAYQPLSLECLVHRLAKEQLRLRKLELQLKELDPLLPYIDPDADDDDGIQVRHGRDAFREEYLKMPDVFEEEYLHVGNCANYWRAAHMNYECPEERSFIDRRLRNNVYARVLDVPTDEAFEIQRNDSREKRTMVIRDSLPIMKNYLMLAENQVSHFLCDEDNPRVIVIKNPELVRCHREHFERLWAGK